MARIDFSRFRFHPVIALPENYDVYDHTKGYDPARLRSAYGVGRYDEKRPGMYATELFGGVRDIHVGIDLAAPVGEPVRMFYDGEIHKLGYNPAPGDYGYVIVTRHLLDGVELYALFGHLGRRSIEGRREGDRVRAGEVIGWVGPKEENGGWNPHLHFQLSYERPETHDLPGVVSEADRARALETYPDPRLVLGPLY